LLNRAGDILVLTDAKRGDEKHWHEYDNQTEKQDFDGALPLRQRDALLPFFCRWNQCERPGRSFIWQGSGCARLLNQQQSGGRRFAILHNKLARDPGRVLW
jgi:hypothetical protein